MTNMIKKAMTVLLAAAMVCAVSCDSQKGDGGQSEPMPEIPTEPVFTEYFPEDFSEITINLEVQNGKPPVNIAEYDVSAHLTPKLSPCKTDIEITEPTVTDELLESIADLNEEEKQLNIELSLAKERARMENLRLKKDSPSAVITQYAVCGGGGLYILVNYDDVCSYSHCFDIIRIALETGEQTTVYSYSDSKTAYNLYRMHYADDSLFVALYSDSGYGGVSGKVLRVRDGALEAVDTSELDRKYKGGYNLSMLFEGRLLVEGWSKVDPNETNDGLIYSDYTIMEYDFSAEKWDMLTSSRYEVDNFSDHILCGEVLMTTDNDADGKASCTLKDRFTLNTGLRSAKLRTATEDRLTFAIVDAIGNSLLYVYDLNTMERSEFDMTGRGVTKYNDMYPVGDNAIFLSQHVSNYTALDHNDTYIFIPTIGAVFDMSSPDIYYFDGRGMVFIDIEDDPPLTEEPEFWTTTDDGTYYLPDGQSAYNEVYSLERDREAKVKFIN